MRETLGNRMSKKLKEYGISQRFLAILTHTTEVSVSRYVNDKRIPKADVLYRIACALHTTTDYLLGLTTSEQTNEEWLHSLNTEQLAEFLFDIGEYDWLREIAVTSDKALRITDIAEWLKQPNTTIKE